MASSTGPGGRKLPGRGALVLAGLVAVAWLVGMFGGSTAEGPLASLERLTLDLRQCWLAPDTAPSDDIVIVGIDDSSLSVLEPELGKWPWPRNTHALIIDYLAAAGARAIVFDILFLEPHVDYPGNDEDLIEATRRAGNVFHAVALERKTDWRGVEPLAGLLLPDPGTRDWPRFAYGKPPLPGLAEAAAGVLVSNVDRDPDGVVRRLPTWLAVGDGVLPAIGFGVYRALHGEGDPGPSLDDHGRALARWFNRPRPYATYRYRAVLESALAALEGETPTLEPTTFEGKVVFVGATAQGLRDEFVTAVAPPPDSGLDAWWFHGIELHAQGYDLFRAGRFLRLPRHAPWLSGLGALALLGLLSGAAWASRHLSIPKSLATLLAGAALALAAIGGAYRGAGLVLPTAAPMLGLLAVWTTGTVQSLASSRAARRHVQALFGRYLAPDVVEQLVQDEDAAAVGGRRRVITVLFSDIRGFTTWSETRRPEEVVALMNEYLSEMADVVARHGGYVDKFIGDAVMALWSVPIEQPDHADRGLAAAREMLARLDALNREWAGRGLSPFRIGIGLHSGEALVGNLGSNRKADYTAIGDTVNTASRLEGMSKQLGTPTVISESCASHLSQRPDDLRSLGSVEIRGRAAGVEVFTLEAPDPAEPAPAGRA